MKKQLNILVTILVTVLFLTSCGIKQADPRWIKGIDKEFVSYVSVFEAMYKKSIGDISIGFEKLESSTVGRCTIWSSGYRQIRIDPDYWHSASEEKRIGLIFHELGHCVLNRTHTSKTFYYSGLSINGYVPASLMHPDNFYSAFFSELESYYFYELFNPAASAPPVNLKKVKTNCVEHL